MTPDSARDVIISLVEHGFDYDSLMCKCHAELRWILDGVNRRIEEKNRVMREQKRKK